MQKVGHMNPKKGIKMEERADEKESWKNNQGELNQKKPHEPAVEIKTKTKMRRQSLSIKTLNASFPE